MSDVAALLAKPHQRLQGLLSGVVIGCLGRVVLRLDIGFGLLICFGCHICYLLPSGRRLPPARLSLLDLVPALARHVR